MKKIEDLLGQAEKVHASVWQNEQGYDPDWPLWYADWLIEHTDILDHVKNPLTKSELTSFLVVVSDEYSETEPSQKGWQHYYATKLVER